MQIELTPEQIQKIRDELITGTPGPTPGPTPDPDSPGIVRDVRPLAELFPTLSLAGERKQSLNSEIELKKGEIRKYAIKVAGFTGTQFTCSIGRQGSSMAALFAIRWGARWRVTDTNGKALTPWVTRAGGVIGRNVAKDLFGRPAKLSPGLTIVQPGQTIIFELTVTNNDATFGINYTSTGAKE